MKLIVGVNDLSTTMPQLAKQLIDDELGIQLFASSNKIVSWFCPKGTTQIPHVWDAPVSSRMIKVGGEVELLGCPYCSGHRVLKGFNDLLTVNPELAKQLRNRLVGAELSQGSNKVVEWVCVKGEAHTPHIWRMDVASRSRGRGCPYCSGHRVLRGFNDLYTTNPALAAELLDDHVGTTVSSGSEKMASWVCLKGTASLPHIWDAPIYKRVKGAGCPMCLGRRLLVGFNDLATVNPDLASQLLDVSLGSQITAGSSGRVSWLCPNGTSASPHIWDASPNSRTIKVGGKVQNLGCPYCAGRKVLAGFNDLATTNPQLASELADKDLGTRLTMGSNKKVTWVCPNGKPDSPHSWVTSVGLRSLGTGCPACSTGGFDPLGVGFVYLFTFLDGQRSGQCFGKSNDVRRRLKEYARELKIVGDPEFHEVGIGSDATNAEKRLLDLLTQYGVPTCGSSGMKTKGAIIEAFYFDEAHPNFLDEFYSVWADLGTPAIFRL